MCTLTYRPLADGFELFFNRDEKRTRGPESPPRVDRHADSVVIAPRDSDFGGSWIAVNDHGFAVAILNGYRAADAESGDFISRGALLLDVARSSRLTEALEHIDSLDPTQYRSFVLALIEPGQTPTIAEWDRKSLVVERNAATRLPLFSSSFQGTEVAAMRRRTFEALGSPQDGPGLQAFHRSHEHGPGPYSVCMHREDAETRSFTHIRVDRDTVSLAYSPAAPCRQVEPMVVSVERRVRGA